MMTSFAPKQLQSKAIQVSLLMRKHGIGDIAPRRMFRTSQHVSSATDPAVEGGGAEKLPKESLVPPSSARTISSAAESAADGGGEEKLPSESPVPPPSARTIRRGPVSWVSLGLAAVTGCGLLLYFDREKRRRIEGLKNATESPRSGPSVGKSAIGGPFRLVNHEGKVVTERDFVGSWTLVYFGFTFCPDICPAELTKLAQVTDNIEKQKGLEIVPLFISLDPERDTVEQVREYLKGYHPRMVGLTGSLDDVRQVARAYRVYYMKTDEEGSEYLVDHSIIMYLMDPNMDFVKFFGKNDDTDAVTAGVIEEIQKASKK